MLILFTTEKLHFTENRITFFYHINFLILFCKMPIAGANVMSRDARSRFDLIKIDFLVLIYRYFEIRIDHLVLIYQYCESIIWSKSIDIFNRSFSPNLPIF